MDRYPVSPARRRFDETFVRLVAVSFDMLEAWARECSDPEFIRKSPEGVSALGKAVIERCDRIVALLHEHGTGVSGDEPE